MKNIYLYIPDKKTDTAGAAIATVISTLGSTPQKAGSSALFDVNGIVAGTIGGGVLEGKVQNIAKEAIRTGESAILSFDLDKDITFSTEAICGGKATILLDAMPHKHKAVFEQAGQLLTRRIPLVLVSVIIAGSDKKPEIGRYIFQKAGPGNIPREFKKKIDCEAARLLDEKKENEFTVLELTTSVLGEKTTVLLEPLFPAPVLVIAGAGHIGKALSHLAKRLGFEVTVIDDRIEFANSNNLPDADNIIVGDIGVTMNGIDKTPDTYFVIVTRGHSDDAKALRNCIGGPAAYLGMIGSKTKIAKMHSGFIKSGWATEKQWRSVHAPIGLEILSKSVEEIAVSIAAELVLCKNQKIKNG
jgi:xanthine dehydrogenase accessory factor